MSHINSDPNVCRYAIGSHDTFLRRGKVNNKTRNVITIAIGEIPEKTAELTANLYGLLNSNEEYEEYHHIGYDITSSRIYENVLRYIERFSDRQKVFFITGARSAGGVANLLAKKLIDTFGQSSVYGYTFNAVSTINGNMIPERSKIPNLKYQPIMNIYNDDEPMIMFTSEETNMYKYGTNVHMSLSENYRGKVKTAFKKVNTSAYDENIKSKVINILNKTFNINLTGYSAKVFGFTETEWRGWDSYTEEEIAKNNAKDLHKASETELEELFNFWSEFYNVTKNNNNFIPQLSEHAEEQINKIRNIKKELGENNIKSSTDAVAYNNAQNYSENVVIETAISLPKGNNANSGTVIYDSGLIKTIASVAKFYINNIATYKGELKTRVKSGNIVYYENDLALEHLVENLTSYEEEDTATIEYTNGKKIKLTKKLDKSANTTEANREFKKINKEDGKDMYIEGNFAMGHYKWKDIINNNNSYQVNTEFNGWDYTKDDCSGSVELVLNIRESENNALYNKGISTNDLMVWNKDTANALYKKGWICYVKNTDVGVWSECNGITFDNITDKTNDIRSQGINFLQPGDILVSKAAQSHAEFYVGNGYIVDYKLSKEEEPSMERRKKSGISSIAIPTSFSKPNGVKAEGTFAWGSVKDEFPVESSSGQKNYFYYDPINDVFRHCQCGNEPDKDDTVHWNSGKSGCEFWKKNYTVIWRKKNEN